MLRRVRDLNPKASVNVLRLAPPRDIKLTLPCMLLLFLLGCAEEEGNYVRATFDRQPVRWSRQRVALYVQAPPPSSTVSHSALIQATKSALRAWTNECAELAFDVLPARTRTAASRDGVNVVVLREDRWCPPRAESKRECYDERLQAVTHLRKGRVATAESAIIEEADIELNGVHHQFSPQALQETLLHEMGHFLGLAHGCATAAARRSVESAAPPCSEQTKLVMHPDPEARMGIDAPSPGELRFVCDIYGRPNGLWSHARPWVWLIACIGLPPIAWLAWRARRASTARAGR